MAEHTPTTDDIRDVYVVWNTDHGAPRTEAGQARLRSEFDRWLAEVKADAWDEADAAHKSHLGAVLGGFENAPPYPTNPYRKEAP